MACYLHPQEPGVLALVVTWASPCSSLGLWNTEELGLHDLKA